MAPKIKNKVPSRPVPQTETKEDRIANQPINPEQGYGDPLSSITRDERRNLLVSNVVLVAITWGALIPTKISALGIDLESSQRYSLVALIFGISLHYLLAFWLYALVDERTWLLAYAEAESKMWDAFSKPPNESSRSLSMTVGSNELPEEIKLDQEAFFLAWKIGQRRYYHRIFFDIKFPIILTIAIWIACVAKLIMRGI